MLFITILLLTFVKATGGSDGGPVINVEKMPYGDVTMTGIVLPAYLTPNVIIIAIDGHRDPNQWRRRGPVTQPDVMQ